MFFVEVHDGNRILPLQRHSIVTVYYTDSKNQKTSTERTEYMPNIELHGFAERTEDVKEAVWASCFHTEKLLTEFSEEVVVTTFPSVTDNKHGRRSPFVRVFFRHDKKRKTACRFLLEFPISTLTSFLMLSL